MTAAPQRKVALGFFAHPDDAEILCGGTLVRLADLGWEIHVTTATPGDCGSADLPPDEIATIRRQEGAAAVASLDASAGATYHCLEESDVRVVCDKPSIHKSIDLMRRIAPSLVFTHPRFDYMLDHEQVHLLARAATFAFPIPNASAHPLVDESAIPWLYYCDPMEAKDPYTGTRISPSAFVDVSDVIDRKLEMLACHASQREWLRSHHGIDEYLEAVKRHCRDRGEEAQVRFAEAFVQHRGHAYPQSDLLAELFQPQTH